MARMLGRKVWDRVACTCCNGPRTAKVERAREKRELARELRPERLLPTAEPGGGHCLHGCYGECLDSLWGDDRCSFSCHPDGPVNEEQYRALRAANSAVISSSR
ncbi:hypothetical protein [Nonomuraea sp. NPDC050310]|uniref:hypothetical protein n=1 Tax=Nonomuraea sp. NPDC050310 TaxID=3154935 RepID=UPI0033D454DF